jgi:heme/copper-type cytochrome/quinol oxidase subunit 2
MTDQLAAALRGFLMIGVVVALAALFDAYRRRKSPGPRPAKKLTRREVFWVILIVIMLVLLGLPVGRTITPPRSDSRPVNISDR